MANTGNTTTLTFSGWITSTSDAAIETIDLPELSVDEIETSTLATTRYKTKVPADLANVGDLTFSMQFAGTLSTNILWDTVTTAREFYVGKTGTILVNFPYIGTTATTHASFGGTGFVKAFKMEEISNDAKMMATVTLGFDGVTGPTWLAQA